MKALSIEAFKSYMDDGFEVVDFRDPESFINGFVPNSFYINPHDENALVLYNQFVKPFNKLIAIFPEETDKGLDSILQNIEALEIVGYLVGGYKTWQESENDFGMLITIDADEFEMDIKHDPQIELMDVRTDKSFEKEHIEGSSNAPIGQIPLLIGELQQDEKFYILANSKSTAVAVGAYLNRHGFTLTRILNGSFDQLKNTSLPITTKKKNKQKDNGAKS